MDVLLSVCWAGLRRCGRCGLWVLKRLLFIVAVVTALGLLGRSAHAAVGYGGCSMPGQMCIQGNSVGVDVSVKQSGNGVPQTPSAGVMNVLVPITVGVAAVGAAAVAIPAVGGIAIAGDAIAAAGMAAIRSGAIQSVALVGLIATLGGDVVMSPDGKVSVAQRNASQGDNGFNGYVWCVGSACGDSPIAACSLARPDIAWASYDSGVCYGQPKDHSASCNPQCAAFVSQVASCVAGYVQSGGGCVPNPSAPVSYLPATDAQVQSAIKAHPSSWPSVYNDMNCGPTLALTDGSTSDPCYAMYRDSRTGFGVSFSTGGSSWTNNGCAVNSTSCPSATVTTAPTTDSSTKTNADGTKTTTTNTTTKTTTVTGTNDRTNPVEGQTTTSTSTSTTVTNADGSTTTTTTTTTDQAPPATAGNANQQQKDQTPPTTATFAGGEWKLYTPKEKTFAQVMQAFVSRVQAMPWYTAMSNFFTVNVSGSCPHWVVPASRFTPALDGTQFFCGSWAMSLYALGGVVTMLVAAWYAWRIAFL